PRGQKVLPNQAPGGGVLGPSPPEAGATLWVRHGLAGCAAKVFDPSWSFSTIRGRATVTKGRAPPSLSLRTGLRHDIIYTYTQAAVHIVAVVHGKRDIPAFLIGRSIK
ncbi:MAG TPA: type II toxin-antitoxin system RelE/ParE family toxin, partial [Terriglobia bacterium]|nr:type II toxin-antitoxin system RelE/ParE family toxin [Terriglobia bacterium]